MKRFSENHQILEGQHDYEKEEGGNGRDPKK
jgi:hypothetical protein